MIRKIVTLLLVIAMLSSLFTVAGCQQNATTTTTGTKATTTKTDATTSETAAGDQMDWEIDTSPITLKVYSDRSWAAPWGKDPVSQKITELTGVTLDVKIPVKDEDSETLSLMMASNDFPDMMQLNATNTTITSLISGGFVKEVDSLMAEFAPLLPDIINTYHGPELLEDFRADDGKNYALYYGYNSEIVNAELNKMGLLYPVWFITFNVRDDYFTEIGRPETNTPEKLMDALMKMKQNHPDKDGYISDSLDVFFYHFGCWDNVGWGGQQVVDGKIIHQIRSEKYRTALKFAFDMAQNDLLPKEGFMNPYDVNAAKFENGDAIGLRSNYDSLINETKIGDTGTIRYALPPLESYALAFQPYPWMCLMIPEAAQKPDRVIRFIEYLASNEGQLLLNYGLEGEKGSYSGDPVKGPHFYFEPSLPSIYFKEGKPVVEEAFHAARQADWNAVAAQSGVARHQYMNNNGLGGWGVWEWKGPDAKRKAYNDMMDKYITYKPEFAFTIISDSPEGVVRAKINTIIEEDELKIVFAETEAEFESLLAAMIQKCDQAGMPQLEAEWTRQYLENMK